MSNDSTDSSGPGSPIPPDDPARGLTVALPEDTNVPCIALAGGVYVILVTGAETASRYCLIEMNVPPGGGPPPHRHDFEEMFTILEGEIEFTFRGVRTSVRAGGVVNIPANAPHFFRNTSGGPARMLCMCVPAGQEEYFMEVGDRVESRTSPPPKLSEEEQAARRAKAVALAPKYRTEFL